MAPIPEMDTIWMDGALVPWADAKVHVLTHALHYGSGVFEGIRAYETERGAGGAPPHRAPRAPRALGQALLHAGAVHASRSCYDATFEVLASNKLDACYIRPLVFRGYGEMGLYPHGRAGAGGHRRVAVGHLPRRGGHQARRARQDEQHPVARPHGAGPRRQGHGPVPQLHPRQDRGAQRRLRRGRSCSRSTATSPRARARTSSSCATACSSRRRRATACSRASRATSSSSSPRARASSCRSARSSRSDLVHRRRGCSSPAPPPRSCRSARSTTTSSASPARSRGACRSASRPSPRARTRSSADYMEYARK